METSQLSDKTIRYLLGRGLPCKSQIMLVPLKSRNSKLQELLDDTSWRKKKIF